MNHIPPTSLSVTLSPEQNEHIQRLLENDRRMQLCRDRKCPMTCPCRTIRFGPSTLNNLPQTEGRIVRSPEERYVENLLCGREDLD